MINSACVLVVLCTHHDLGPLSVTEFLPKNFVTDGSVSYQNELQKAIDTAAGAGRPLMPAN